MARLVGSLTKSHRVAVARQRAWNAIRVFKVFRASDVAAPADINEANLQKYLHALQQAGYLRIDRPKQNGKTLGHAIWRLVDNTGPQCPIVRRNGVYDPNQQQIRPFCVSAQGREAGSNPLVHSEEDDEERVDDDGDRLDHRVA